jgi:hypothetical protein
MELISLLVLSTAVLGVFLFLPLIKRKKAPRIIIYSHGSFAIASVFFLTKSFLYEGNVPVASLVLFILAAINGLYMFYLSEIRRRSIPPALIVLHANLAVIAFISLIYFVWFGGY